VNVPRHVLIKFRAVAIAVALLAPVAPLHAIGDAFRLRSAIAVASTVALEIGLVFFVATILPITAVLGVRIRNAWLSLAAAAVVGAALAGLSVAESRAQEIPDAGLDAAAALALLAVTAALQWSARRFRRVDAIALCFPLRHGEFAVFQGGSSRFSNHHHRAPSQRYALDITKIGPLGASSVLFATACRQSNIFGEPVYSPSDGVVVRVADGYRDGELSEPQTSGPPAGNAVEIEIAGATVLLAHLRSGSVAVEPSQRVRAGDLIGYAGNSGNTSEPHLHIHAERDGRGVPMLFEGRFLVRNSRMTRS